MIIKKMYFNGKAKAFNLSYDDGITQDSRFVSLINKYGLKCTFNLNSGIQSENHWWKHESGLFIHRLNKETVLHLYYGHEIASHSFNHQRLTDIKGEALEKEIEQDKRKLEEWFQCEIKGFAYPFGPYNEETTECVKKAGFKYARVGSISSVAENFEYSKDRYKWEPSIFQCNPRLEAYVHKFIDTNSELALCGIVGHSYELDVYNMWNRMEIMFAEVSDLADVWTATTIDIVEYLEAMSNAYIEKDKIVNISDKDLWFEINGIIVKVEKGSTYNLFNK